MPLLTPASPSRTAAIKVIATAGLLVGSVAGLTACGASGTPSAVPSTSAAPSGTSASAARARGAAPGAFGTVAALSGSSLEVQNRSTGQTTVSWTATTAFSQTEKATRSAITVGSCVTAAAAPSPSASPSARPTGPLTFTAATVVVTPAQNDVCGGFGGPNGTGSPRSRPSGVPSEARPSGSRPSGTDFGAERASGKVTGVSGDTVTVVVSRSATAVTDRITIGAGTAITADVSVAPTALKLGECVAAFGKADDTGAVTATRISISEPDSSGQCTTGFGGGFGRRSAAPAATGGTSG